MLKLCRCGKPIPIQQSSCDACKDKQKDRYKQYDQHARDKESNAFYHSREWIAKRREALTRDNGLCLHCLKKKRIKRAEMVDHIIPIKVDWSKRLSLNNLQSLCNSCHNIKTAEDKKKYPRGI